MYGLNPVPPALVQKQEMKQKTFLKTKNCAPPKPMSYAELLNLAEKLQYEPVVVKKEKRLRTAQELKVLKIKARNDKRGLHGLPHVKKMAPNSPPDRALKESRLTSPLRGTANSGKKRPSQSNLTKEREPPKLGKEQVRTEQNPPSRATTSRPGGSAQGRPVSSSVSRPSKSVSDNLKRKYEDEEENSDSEMDDFIVNDDLDQDKISKHIREIFGYDRRKYKDESEDDLRFMESSWSEQQKEEAKSLRLAKLEDKEEEKRELEEKKLKKAKRRKLTSNL